MATFLNAYNAASQACVVESRSGLARAIRAAREFPRGDVRRLIGHCNYVGWPIRKRPNGQFS